MDKKVDKEVANHSNSSNELMDRIREKKYYPHINQEDRQQNRQSMMKKLSIFTPAALAIKHPENSCSDKPGISNLVNFARGNFAAFRASKVR